MRCQVHYERINGPRCIPDCATISMPKEDCVNWCPADAVSGVKGKFYWCGAHLKDAAARDADRNERRERTWSYQCRCGADLAAGVESGTMATLRRRIAKAIDYHHLFCPREQRRLEERAANGS